MNSNDDKTTEMPKLPDAATVILIRDRDRGSEKPFEIFLMRRHRKQNFMGGAFVFPGGRLDEADCDPALLPCGMGLSAEGAKLSLNEPDLSGDRALGLFFTAVRETFEEAGVLLAAPISGVGIDFSHDETYTRFAEYRSKLHEQEMSLKELAEKENIHFTLDMLTPYSHWITPEIEGKRFNTRFLLARMPEGQIPVHDSIEMTESKWITPMDALKLHESGEILLMPPTLKTVEELSAFLSVEQLFTASASSMIEPILPQVFSTSVGFGVILPHDIEYSIDGYKQPVSSDEPSRIVMIDGRWRTMRAEEFDIHEGKE